MKRSTATRAAMAAILAGLVPPGLAAHDGHAPRVAVDGLIHWLSSPDHLTSVVVGTALLVGALGVRRLVGRVVRPRETAPGR